MAKLYNLARMTTATSGTGTITLLAAVAGFLTFAAAGIQDGETISYAISDGSNSEIGRGVYTASGTTLTRTVLRSTNSNNPISLSGNAQVFITATAEDFAVSHGQCQLTKDVKFIPGNIGTPIGDMSGGTNGLAGAFNGIRTENQSAAALKGTSTSGFNNTIGKDWGVGNSKTIQRFVVYAPRDNNILGGAGGTTLKLQGSNDNSAWTDLTGSLTFPAGVYQSLDIYEGINVTNAYRYHRLNISGNGVNSAAIAELEFYEGSNNLILLPKNGNRLIINGQVEIVPQAGVSLAPPTAATFTVTIASPAVVTATAHGLSAGDPFIPATTGALPTGLSQRTFTVSPTNLTSNTFQLLNPYDPIGSGHINTSGTQSGTHRFGRLRHIYAYMNGSVMTLEHSTIPPTVDANGVEIKTGDATRTRVGMAIDDGTNWVNSPAKRFVRSCFNHSELALENPYKSGFGGTPSQFPTFVDVTSGSMNRGSLVEWISLAGDLADMEYSIDIGSSTTNNLEIGLGIGFDHISPASGEMNKRHASGVSVYYATTVRNIKSDLPEGYHCAAMYCAAISGDGSSTSCNIGVWATSGLCYGPGLTGTVSGQVS